MTIDIVFEQAVIVYGSLVPLGIVFIGSCG